MAGRFKRLCDIQTTKINARGFRSFENFRTRILFFCGKLDLRPISVGSH